MPAKAWIIMKPQNWQVEISPDKWNPSVSCFGKQCLLMEDNPFSWKTWIGLLKNPFGRVVWEHGLMFPTHTWMWLPSAKRTLVNRHIQLHSPASKHSMQTKGPQHADLTSACGLGGHSVDHWIPGRRNDFCLLWLMATPQAGALVQVLCNLKWF